MCELERGPLKLQRGQFASGAGEAAHEDFDPSELHADAVRGIVIASSLPAFASGLVSWFENPVGRWRVDAVCQGADEVLARVAERVPCLIVATDELDAAGLMGLLRASRLDVIALVLAMDVAFGREALLVRAGAGGVLPLAASRTTVVNAAATLVAGGSVVSAAALRLITTSDSEETAPRLTVRQREVLGLLGQGLSVQQIADRLVVEVSTVKTHIDRTRGKFGLHDQRALALNAHAILGGTQVASSPGPWSGDDRECRPADDAMFGHPTIAMVAGKA